MRATLALTFCLMLCAANTANAGAWMRAEGTTFTSTAFSANYFRDISSTTYIEHGLRDDVTVGLDVAYFTSRFGTTSGYGTVFIRRPLNWGADTTHWAYELGAGTAWAGELVLPHVKAGLSWGRGFQLGERYGWMTVDASITVDVTYGQPLSKIDATVGMGLTEQVKGMMQVYLSHLEGETFTTLAPSVVYSPKASKLSIQFGAQSTLGLWDDTALKLGIWREF